VEGADPRALQQGRRTRLKTLRRSVADGDPVAAMGSVDRALSAACRVAPDHGRARSTAKSLRNHETKRNVVSRRGKRGNAQALLLIRRRRETAGRGFIPRFRIVAKRPRSGQIWSRRGRRWPDIGLCSRSGSKPGNESERCGSTATTGMDLPETVSRSAGRECSVGMPGWAGEKVLTSWSRLR